MEGTKGDLNTKEMIKRILNEGCLDKNPRPVYKDFYVDANYNKNKNIITTKEGLEITLNDNQKVNEYDNIKEVITPAHTLSVNHAMMSYDLSKDESPLLTLRPIATKSSIAELLWIYQKQSNDLVEFDELLGYNDFNETNKIHNWWLDWAIKDNNGNFILNEKGHPTIGQCYGKTVCDHNLVDNLISEIKKDPDGRRHIISMWQNDDFNKKHGLKPCAYMTVWNVRHEKDGIDYLDMCLFQRSSDFLTAGSINQFQYVVFQNLIANHLGYKPGKFTWFIDNVQIYDRHISQAKELLQRQGINCTPKIEVTKNNFYDLKPNDIKLTGYPRELIKKKNPQLKFPLGI